VLVNDRTGELSIDESVVRACFGIVFDGDVADHEGSPGEEGVDRHEPAGGNGSQMPQGVQKWGRQMRI
jgi:hypothetical protein